MGSTSRVASFVYSIVWTDTGANTNVTPDSDPAIPIDKAVSIVVQADSTHASNTATDIDVNVITSVDGTHYDTENYAGITSMGDNQVKTISVTPGPAFLKLRLDVNSASTTAYVTARVLIIAEG